MSEKTLDAQQVCYVLAISYPTLLNRLESLQMFGKKVDDSKQTSKWKIPISEVKRMIELQQNRVDGMNKRFEQVT